MPEVAVGVGPFVPDSHPVLLQITHISVAGKEPQQLMDDTLQMHLFGGYEGESLAEVITVLIAEHRNSTRACSVGLHGAVLQNVAQHLVILNHA